MGAALTNEDKRSFLRRAKALLDAGNDADLHYAALDLRLCIEAITYGKLQSFTEHLPPSMLQRTWQPPQRRSF
jgi:hypothetical protein